jgi:hypothetical protein
VLHSWNFIYIFLAAASLLDFGPNRCDRYWLELWKILRLINKRPAFTKITLLEWYFPIEMPDSFNMFIITHLEYMYWLKLFFIYYHTYLVIKNLWAKLLAFKSTFLNLESFFIFFYDTRTQGSRQINYIIVLNIVNSALRNRQLAAY